MNYFLCCLLLAAWSCCGVYGYSSTFYTDNDLGQTIPVGTINNRQKKEIQQEILELMGLYSKPKRNVKEKLVESASEFMQELYKRLTDGDSEMKEGLDDTHIHIKGKVNASALGLDPSKVDGCDVIVSFVNNAKKVPHLRHERERTFYFDFSEVAGGEILKGAELRLYKEVSHDLSPGSFVITVYRIKQGKDWEDKILQEEVKMTVDWDKEGWLALDVTKAAEDWTFFPYSNMGLYLKVTDSYGRDYDPSEIGLVDSRRGGANKLPFLVGYLQMSQDVLSRRTRSIRNRRWAGATNMVTFDTNPYVVYSRHKRSYPRYVSNTVCQRHDLYINFTDIGFSSEFLIAPAGYRAFYCAGHCSFPLGIHMNSTNHAIVQTLVHLLKPNHVPKPCCAPTKFGAITLLYYDNKSSIRIRQFRDMTVKACGCH